MAFRPDTALFKQLLAYRAPHPRQVHDYACPIGDVASVGVAARHHVAERTKNGSFSRAIVDSDFGALIVWWSYATPIAIQHMPSGYALVSSYNYSKTTSRHQCDIRLLNDMPEARMDFYGHVGDGLEPADVIEQRKGWVHQRKLEMSRAREQLGWKVRSFHAAMEKLKQGCAQLGETVQLPEFREGLTDKALAKLTGKALNDPQLAQVIQKYNEMRSELNG